MAAARKHLNGQHRHGEVIVIGDTVHDIVCGRSIEARCVAVPTGHTTAESLRAGDPDVMVDTLEDAGPILALLDG
jgi:phosphoglycolate phosphatase-like HAD superfamily hydrolase